MSDTATGTPGHPFSRLLLLCFGLIGVFAFLQVYSVQAILPLLLQDFQASVVQVGNTVGATVLAVALTSPFVGMLSDAIGRKKIIVGSLLFLAIPTGLIAATDSIQLLTLLRFLQGLAVPGITVVTIAYIGEEFRGKDMTRMMSAYVAGTVLGGFLGRFLLGHLVEWMDWRSAFLVMSALTVCGALLVWRILPRSRRFVANRHLHSSLQTLGSHLRNPAVLTACAVGFCILFSLVGGFTYINLHLSATPYHFSTADLANVFAVYLLGVVITPISGKILPLLGARKTILIAMSISVLGLLLTLLPAAWMIIVALAIMSCGIFITQSSTISFIAHRVPTGRSLASGLYYMGYYAGGSVGAWVCGLAYTAGAWPLTVAVILVAQLLSLVLVFWLMPPPAQAATLRQH
ncbi:MFS transporter [Brachymonas chironomi]|uniref:MFS transporter n=1 Tax=Brachymonas chironomi TaxID=491919 RepID=UPI000372EBB9|nr:MFS transporter [Brachymonas chironomi]